MILSPLYFKEEEKGEGGKKSCFSQWLNLIRISVIAKAPLLFLLWGGKCYSCIIPREKKKSHAATNLMPMERCYFLMHDGLPISDPLIAS